MGNMSTHRFRMRGRDVEVTFEKRGRRLAARCGEEELVFVPASRGDNLYHLHLGTETLAVWVARTEEAVWVSVDGETYRFDRPGPAGEIADVPEAAVFEPGAHTLKVPMPGRVSRILVHEGDLVGLDQPLVVVEAMKIENAVHSPAPCRIQRLHVTEGDTVGLGDPLLEVMV